MGIGKEESEDTAVDCSWIPRSPDSPVQLKPHLIHDDVQRHPNPASLSESDQTEGCLVGCLPTSNASSVGVTARRDSILHDYVQPFQFTADKTAAYWNRISFESLLHLANAASMKYMGTTTPWNHGVPFPATQWNNATYTPESQLRNANVCSGSNTPHFEPVTPEKPVGTGKRQIANTQHSCTGEQQTEEKYGEELRVARGGSTVQVLESGKEIQRETTCTSRDAASSLAEYPRMDDGGNHATELNSTPQLKPKRKKHRPKVITEGKPRPRKIAEKPGGSTRLSGVQPFQFTADNTAAFWNRISFESLLHLANAASMKYMGTTTPWNHGVPFPATQWNNATYTSESQLRNANVCSSSNTPHFEPVTPEKPVGTGKRQIANTQHSCTGEQQTEENYGEELRVARGGSTIEVLESGKEIQRETTCTSRDAASSLAEYPRMDDGGNHATELNSTPQLKPKRKKHRPKVITEGKPRPRKIAEKPGGSTRLSGVQPFQFTADNTAAFWNRISFESLLHLANAASMKYMGTTTPWNHGVPFPATQWNNATYTSESQLRNANVCSSSNTPHFEPVTPEKPVGTGKRQIANTQHSCTGEQQTEENYGEELRVARGGSTIEVLESGKEIQRETTCTSRDAASSLAEYPRMDDGGNHATELNSTPQLKPKRKKHRPKVITEGKPRPRKIAEKPDGSNETPRIKKNHAKVADTAVPCSTSETSEVQAINQKIQEPSDSKETGICKRKYVGRRKVPTTLLLEEDEDFVDEWTIGSGNMEENQGSRRKNPGRRARNKMSTPPTELVEVVVKQEMAGDARTTSRRALNFEMEGQLHNESLRYSLMHGVDSHPKEEFCAEEDQTTSVHVGFQIDLAARKSGSSPAPDMTTHWYKRHQLP